MYSHVSNHYKLKSVLFTVSARVDNLNFACASQSLSQLNVSSKFTMDSL